MLRRTLGFEGYNVSVAPDAESALRSADVELPDLLSVPLIVVSVSGVILGVSQSGRWGWADSRTIGSIVAGLAVGVYVSLRSRRHPRPLLDLSLFRKPSFTGVSIVAFTLSAGMFAMFLYLTLYIQDVLSYSPLEAGLRFLPSTVLSFFVAPIAGRLLGRVPARVQELLDVTRESLDKAIVQCRVGNRLGDISHAVQAHCEGHGFSVVREFVGHGIGASLHEEPQIANYGDPGRGPRLAEGMTLAIEPMVNVGKAAVKMLPDGWTAVTRDGSLSAHFEHTIAVTKEGPLVLTRAAAGVR